MSAPGYQISRDPTAVVGTRTAAWIVDFLLYFVLIVGVLGPTPLSPLAEYAKVPDGMSMDTACNRVGDLQDVSSCFLIGDRVYFTDSSDAAIQIVGWLAYVGLIYIVWQGITGLTPGKLLFGLRAVGADGKAPGMGKAFIRSALWIVDGLPCIPLVGFITALTSTGHRRVGDMAAKTFVVGKGDMGQPVMVPGLTTGTYGTPTVYGAAPGYPPQVPSSAPWGTAPGGPGAQGAPGAPWGAPPGAPPPPASPYPATDARPAPPPAAPSYGAPAGGPGGYETPAPTTPTTPAPSGGYPAPGAAGPAAGSTPDASAFGESTDPADSDLPTDDAPATDSPEVAKGAADGGAAPASIEASEPPTAEGGTSTSTDEPATEPTAAPAASPAPEAAPTTAGATTEQGYSPQWDAARGAYIQWDPNRSRWLQWDDAAKEWKPI